MAFDALEETLRSVRGTTRLIIALAGATFLVALVSQSADRYRIALEEIRQVRATVRYAHAMRNKCQWSVGGESAAIVFLPNSSPVRLETLPSFEDEASTGYWLGVATELQGPRILWWRPKKESVHALTEKWDPPIPKEFFASNAQASLMGWKAAGEEDVQWKTETAARMTADITLEAGSGEEFPVEVTGLGYFEEFEPTPVVHMARVLPVYKEIQHLSLGSSESYLESQATDPSMSTVSILGQSVPAILVVLVAPTIHFILCVHLLMLAAHTRRLRAEQDSAMLSDYPYLGALGGRFRWISCGLAVFIVPLVGQILVVRSATTSVAVVIAVVIAGATSAVAAWALGAMPKHGLRPARSDPRE